MVQPPRRYGDDRRAARLLRPQLLFTSPGACAGRGVTGPFQGYEQVAPVPEATYSQMGWEIFANGLHDILLRVHRDYHPPAIVVTENGVAFDDTAQSGDLIQDRRRIDFLRQHIVAMQTARQMGVPVRGYCVWTLMDNFEWTHGYQQQFGLVAVNRFTQQRTIKESGRWLKRFIALQVNRPRK